MSREEQASAGAQEYFGLRLSGLRERRLVRADRRNFARMESTSVQNRRSLMKTEPQTVVASIHNRLFGTDVLYIRTKNTVGARERATALIARGEM